jgi:hypothetical protein
MKYSYAWSEGFYTVIEKYILLLYTWQKFVTIKQNQVKW